MSVVHLAHAHSALEVAKPSDYGIPYDELNLITPDHVTLRCYMLRQRKNLISMNPNTFQLPAEAEYDLTEDEVNHSCVPLCSGVADRSCVWQFVASRPTVIMFHGNAGNHGHRIPLAKVFYLRLRCNVLMMCYRGWVISIPVIILYQTYLQVWSFRGFAK